MRAQDQNKDILKSDNEAMLVPFVFGCMQSPFCTDMAYEAAAGKVKKPKTNIFKLYLGCMPS